MAGYAGFGQYVPRAVLFPGYFHDFGEMRRLKAPYSFAEGSRTFARDAGLKATGLELNLRSNRSDTIEKSSGLLRSDHEVVEAPLKGVMNEVGEADAVQYLLQGSNGDALLMLVAFHLVAYQSQAVQELENRVHHG